MLTLFYLFLIVLSFTNVIYFLTLNSFYFITNIISFGALKKYSRRLKSLNIEKILSSSGAPPISLLVPSYNEEATCVSSVRALLSLQYPNFEVILVNDGSKDNTFETLKKAYQLEPTPRIPVAMLPTQEVHEVYQSQSNPKLWVIDKANGGKADALNVGINYCQSPLFCAIDADSLLERDALLRIVRPFLEKYNTVAAGGIIRIVNGCEVQGAQIKQVRLPKSNLARFQVLEYLRSFLAGRMSWAILGGTFIISGAFGVFKRNLVVRVGGYSTDTVGEDMELIVRLHRYCRDQKMDYDIAFIPDPVAWTECPETFKILGNQRDRWQRGLVQTLWRHKGMFLNPKYGRIGLLAYPYYFLLEMMGPVIELLGYCSVALGFFLGQLSLSFMLVFFLVAFIYGSITSIFSIALEELTFRRYKRMDDLIQLMLMAVFENFGYRQILTYYRFRGMLNLVIKRKQDWGAMTRKGFEEKKEAEVA